MIILKSKQEIELMKQAGRLVAACHREIGKLVQPGITTLEIEDLVDTMITKHGGRAFTKGYNGYKYATCASVNDVIAHGFPSRAPLQEGDIVTIDIVAEVDGWLGDSAWTYAVGSISDEARRLMEVTKQCLDLGIAQALAGNRLGDITHAIQSHAERNGYSVVRDLLAHGIGRDLHEEPSYAHVGPPGKGIRLKEGFVFTIEPMINAGTHHMYVEADGWTARTADGRLSAQYEHTIAITEDGPLLLTDQATAG
ncbi:type I methionyl aminopeptidase [Paenibacillus elgii]